MAWTAVDADTSWQDLAVAAEIAEAYNLRRAACGLTQIDAPGADTAVFDFVSALQSGIEELWSHFADASAPLSGASGLPEPYPSLYAMMFSAGLGQSGYWRRIAEGGVQPAVWSDYAAEGWAYGRIQSADLAGPWLFLDLQAALSALRRMLASPSGLPGDIRYAATINNSTDPYPPSVPSYGDLSGSYSNYWSRRAYRIRYDGVTPNVWSKYYAESFASEVTAENVPAGPATYSLVGMLRLPVPVGTSEMVFCAFELDGVENESFVLQSGPAASWTAEEQSDWPSAYEGVPVQEEYLSADPVYHGFRISELIWVVDFAWLR